MFDTEGEEKTPGTYLGSPRSYRSDHGEAIEDDLSASREPEEKVKIKGCEGIEERKRRRTGKDQGMG
jgi:hypothetical protein